MNAVLVFPHQLFQRHPSLQKGDLVVLTEDPLFFGTDQVYPLQMHAQKLVLHRASMKAYEAQLLKKGYEVKYVPYQKADLKLIFAALKKRSIELVKLANPVDNILQRRIERFASSFGLTVQTSDTPMFINTAAENAAFFRGKKRYFMKTFYQHQRQRLGILLDDDGQPRGGAWSFDAENRKKLPRDMLSELPRIQGANNELFVKEAQNYVVRHFPNALGSAALFRFPVTHAQAKSWLKTFLKERFALFGPFEDAIVPDENWLYHSVLTPALNIGLVTPQEVINAALEFAEEQQLELPSVEGFVRQIIGWREFMRVSYEEMGVQMRNGNHWGHSRSLPASFYDGTTGIEPLDNVIKRILETGYCHHIERLMILGGFFFLCEIQPKEVYRWFMEMFVDSYDWVMVPNVYAMSQNSCGGLITTKPYFSGSNYVLKMSHYKKGEWSEIWDGLYWRFIHQHAAALAKNPRWSMMCRQLEKMDEAKLKRHLAVARSFLKTLKN